MKINSVRIKNFRTIRNEVTFNVPHFLSVVGPNNSGKSNIARALEVFFSGRNGSKYDPKSDLPHGVQREKTSITITFSVDADDEWDSEFLKLYESLRVLHENPPEIDGYISLNLYFTELKPVYQFFSNLKRPSDSKQNAQYSRILAELLEMIFDHFKVYYVPSVKGFSEIFRELIFPELKLDINPLIIPVIPMINKTLHEASDAINSFLHHAGLDDIHTDISISESSIDSLVTKIDFMIEDNIRTELSGKGTGIQSASIFAALLWINERKIGNGAEILWIIEEPESYLHPELTRTVFSLLASLSEKSKVIVTTHSLAFVPKEVECIVGCSKVDGSTVLSHFASFHEATDRIRRSIGVKFSDFYNLSNINIAVEGKTDRSIFDAVLNSILEKGFVSRDEWRNVLEAKFLTFSGVRELAEFVRVTYEYVKRECVFISVFDGDEAGVKARKDLQGFFSNRKPPVQFQSNADFVSVRAGFPIEGLFSDRILTEVYNENKSYFSSFSLDAAGIVEPFKIIDNHKAKSHEKMLDKLFSSEDIGDYSRFISVFNSLNAAIESMK